MREFARKAATPKGVLLLAVNKGKLSEGIDFADDLCRAVFLVGVPFPPIKDRKIVMKKEFLDWQMKQFNENRQAF